MISLGLDLSSHAGWATCAGDGTRPTSGVWELPWTGEIRRMGGMLLRLDALLTEVVRTREVKICAIEEPFQSFGAKNAKTQLMLWNLCGKAQEVCDREGVDFLIVQPSRWRTVFLPRAECKGDEWKTAAVRRCQDLGWPAKDHNAAEACGIWAWLKSGNEPGWQARVLGAEKMALPKATRKFFEKRARLG